ncbi:hypothetical protein BFP70_16750 [Thioclava sp. SK-1]|nr:hypothetical protein BFP70_16750 [Thioclava sp. SK-1]
MKRAQQQILSESYRLYPHHAGADRHLQKIGPISPNPYLFVKPLPPVKVPLNHKLLPQGHFQVIKPYEKAPRGTCRTGPFKDMR